MARVRHLNLTVIMPVAPGANPKPAIKSLTKSIPKNVSAELITITGTHPTRQRNLAAFRAKGRILWFLDHDAIVTEGSVAEVIRAIRHGKMDVVGGPNHGLPSRRLLPTIINLLNGSWLGAPLILRRYGGSGAGPATERDLILCNLAVSRDAFLRESGFDPRLYPNEENEFMNRLVGRGGQMGWMDSIATAKPRAETWPAFIRECVRYGGGRAAQIWINPALSDLVHLVALAVWIAAVGSVVGVIGLAVGGFDTGMLTTAGMIAAPFLAFPVTAFAFEADRQAREAIRGGQGIVRQSVIAMAFFLGLLVRYCGYFLGMAWGLLRGWRSRAIRLNALPVDFSRFLFRSGSFRISESSSFDLGSITMKGAFRHA